ncbi:MAG: hypothetical protein RBT49_10285 [Bacteroidales bacterium]|jgi:predicted SAM-dependent methyltransferase|nr:hypothetical protein [Bacteroidales bacterium]
MNNIKIVCGAGKTKFNGWLSLNIETLDITKDKDFNFLFKEKSIDNILLEHVVEHLLYEEFVTFLTIVKKYLKHGGNIRIAVPDKNHPSKYVQELTGINGKEPGAHDHKTFYNIEDFTSIANKTGYKLVGIEFFTNEHFFVGNDFNYENGYISRCSKNYTGRFTKNQDEYKKMIESVPEKLRNQFKEKNISYTSLLVDFIYE